MAAGMKSGRVARVFGGGGPDRGLRWLASKQSEAKRGAGFISEPGTLARAIAGRAANAVLNRCWRQKRGWVMLGVFCLRARFHWRGVFVCWHGAGRGLPTVAMGCRCGGKTFGCSVAVSFLLGQG